MFWWGKHCRAASCCSEGNCKHQCVDFSVMFAQYADACLYHFVRDCVLLPSWHFHNTACLFVGVSLFCCNRELHKASVIKPLDVSVLCGAIETTATHP